YPQGPLAAHVVGMTDIDNKGIAGIEKSFDATLHGSRDPLRLAIDLRVQTVLREELTRSMNDFHAIGAIGMVMDVRTGELAGMVSLPDFDPNAPSDPQAMFNRATLGVYEMGSTFKLFNTAISLDLGLSNLGSAYDTSPIKVGKFTITDYHPFNRPLSVTEILIHSSNLGSARMALEYGTENQKAFLAKFGLLKAPHVELPEVGTPLVPSPWREINTMTISYGHGIAVTPVHLITGVSALVNGGEWRPATLLKHEPGTGIAAPRQVIKPETSEKLRKMMRMVVESGTGSKADVPGYFVGGKTGTAEKLGAGGYRHKALLSSFIATFPTIDPKYVVLAMIDEPQGTKESFGYATGGWVAAPAVGRIVSRIGPMLGIAPIGVPEVQREQMVRHAIAKEPKVAAAE
ncbi:MAG: penicillin-binding protein 2, partial [Rhodospirillales bacterium]|nr:penicillin-binding protein 2 [Rhodospirillales bacterium]